MPKFILTLREGSSLSTADLQKFAETWRAQYNTITGKPPEGAKLAPIATALGGCRLEPVKDPHEDFANALSLLRREYLDEVEACAKSLFEECRSGDPEDGEALADRLHSLCDGHSWVIWTRKAQVVAIVSENGDRGIEDGLTTGGKDGGIDWSGLAYAALEADIQEALSRLMDDAGMDLNDAATWKQEGEESDGEGEG